VKKIEAWTTADGMIFLSEGEAKKHADERYGKALLQISKQMVDVTDGKYGRTSTFIEENLDKFLELHFLREDIKIGDTED